MSLGRRWVWRPEGLRSAFGGLAAKRRFLRPNFDSTRLQPVLWSEVRVSKARIFVACLSRLVRTGDRSGSRENAPVCSASFPYDHVVRAGMHGSYSPLCFRRKYLGRFEARSMRRFVEALTAGASLILPSGRASCATGVSHAGGEAEIARRLGRRPQDAAPA
jgi:hypothetical protein